MKEEETNDWDLAGHQLGPWVTLVRHRERDEALDWPLMLSFVPGILPESHEGDGEIR
jgi:hypothetical protein